MWAEAQVLQHFQKKYYRILKSRWRTPFAEIDLVMEDPEGGIWIFEVKSLSSFDFITERLTQRQKARLQRAHAFVQGKTQRAVRLALVFVSHKGEILVFEDF